MEKVNKQILLAARPSGWPAAENFQLSESAVPEPKDGEVLIQVLWLSVDPYMRGRMSDRASYADPVPVGGVMTGGAVGRVTESRNKRYREGDIVQGVFGWQQWFLSDGRGLQKVDPKLGPISTALGVLGMPGLTAYFGLFEVGQIKAGETVFITGAAGAVGSIAGQLGKIAGCRVAGSAGSQDKIRWIRDELGFDAAYDYKSVKDYRAALAEACPKGIDCFFDNTGGPQSDAAILSLAYKARVVICGQIAHYNAEKPEMGPRILFNLIIRRARIEGFLVLDYADRFAQALARMSEWVKDGRLKYRETVVDGIENAPAAFLGMMRGENTGKQLVRVAQE
jgi:hypothetical protein